MTQRYIGIRNGFVVCLDSWGIDRFTGRLYSNYLDGMVFDSRMDMLKEMQSVFDQTQFPFESTNRRLFIDNEENENSIQEEIVMNDDELLNKKGDLGTFIIRVQHRQNASWQGRITWLEKNETLQFRSVWEMARMIDNAVEKSTKISAKEKVPQWKDK